MTKESDLIPPDLSQCQAYPNVARHTAFNLGPGPIPERCENTPVCLAVEIEPGKDGLKGSMTLCETCRDLMMEHRAMRNRIQIVPISQ